MKQLSTKEIRQVFLEFFEKNKHHFLEGASIIPKNDPSLLYINSGMAPLKNYFLGEETPPNKLLCNIQPCIRTNDIEEVGDRHHLTFFEMMGSWSIGGYYKKVAIQLAYDLLVNHFEYSPDQLYATVYKGNEALSIPPDTESIQFWKEVGLAEDHIVLLGEDNFWGPAGETGPCGPCTEVFFDTGDQYGPEYHPGGHFDDVNRYIEIWNAGVFMELNKMTDGSFDPLPSKSVDTGAGLERMYLALNDCDSLYDVDVIKPVYDLAKELLSGPSITESDFRVVTDHMRSSTFILSEGVKPSKDGRGYIVRRLIRKCVSVAVRAGIEPLKLLRLSEEVINQLQEFYPTLESGKQLVQQALSQEINDFEPVIKRGLELLDAEIKALSGGSKTLNARSAFDLVTSHGVPFEIVSEYAQAQDVQVDKDQFDVLYREHQKISRNVGHGNVTDVVDLKTLGPVLVDLDETQFTGYEHADSAGKVIALLKNGVRTDRIDEKGELIIIMDESPFYAEGGGQVGDQGSIRGESFTAEVSDVKKVGDIHLHFATLTDGVVNVEEVVRGVVDEQRRSHIRKNHSATHLLHSALRSILGSHVKQKGSLVNEDKLRFDFQHEGALSAQQLIDVEAWVNQSIWQSMSTSVDVQDYQKALDSGVIALFGEKYDDLVRVVKLGDVSAELCGGTHVANSGEIGLLKITSESSVSKGVRRVEAVTGESAFQLLSGAFDTVTDLQRVVGTVPDDMVEYVKGLKKAAAQATKKQAAQAVTFDVNEKLAANIAYIETKLERKELLIAGEQELKKQALDAVLLFAPGEKKHVNIVLVKDTVTDKYHANSILDKWITPLNGRGGGKKTMAQGGTDSSVSSNDVLIKAREALL